MASTSTSNNCKSNSSNSNKDEPPNKKVKSGKKDEEPPPYGSQEYWDARYKKNKEVDTTIINEGKNTQTKEEEEGLPYHTWYFSYQDLKPLILPLILGDVGGNNGTSVLYAEDSENEEEEEDSGVVEEEEVKEMAVTTTTTLTTNIDEEKVVMIENDNNGKDDDDIDDTNDDNDDGNNSQQREEEEEIVIIEEEEEILIEEDDDDDDQIPPERIGVAVNGPVSVLEIGCGDVPLGKELAIDLIISLNKRTATTATNDNDNNDSSNNITSFSDGIIKNITCCDYSKEVIDLMIAQKMDINTTSKDTNTNADDKLLMKEYDKILDFQTIDARDMDYDDESFELILEKGTLDAMLSDKVNGITNCQAIMSECARILTIGGYIFLVSHLNAHTDDGIDWLHQVVMTGLQRGNNNDDDSISWDIEVHGSAVPEDNEGDNNESTGSPGPCVYIIQKKKNEVNDDDNTNFNSEKSSSSEDDGGLSLRFFSY